MTHAIRLTRRLLSLLGPEATAALIGGGYLILLLAMEIMQ